jgi:hypothetical protein
MATPHASQETESASATGRGHGEARPELALVDPWYAYRGPLNPKILELEGTFKDIFDALGGGEAFLKELRSDPKESQP